MQKSITIGITSVGSGIGQSIVDAGRRSGLSLKIIGFDINPFCFGGYDCDVLCRLPPVGDENYLTRLLAACKEHGIQVLIPGLDSELRLLAVNRVLFESRGTKVVVASPEFVDLCRDKLQWGKNLSALSPVVLPCFAPEDLPAALASGRLHFPLIAKPLDGSASAGVQILAGPEDLGKIGPGQVIQPLAMPVESDSQHAELANAVAARRLLQVAEISVQSVYTADGALLGRMVTRNRLKDGVPLEIIPVELPGLAEALQSIEPYLLSLGMRGPVNLQGRMTAEGPRFFEMNARFTGITGTRALLGFNEVEAVIRDALGKHPQPGALKVNARRIAVRQVGDRTVDVVRHPELRRVAALRGHRCGGQHVLVTGASGWLGRNLCAALLADDRVSALTVLTRDAARVRTLLPETTKEVTVSDDGAYSAGRVDLAYHLASGRPVDSLESQADGFRYGQEVIACLAANGLSSLVNISSQSVYGTKRPTPWHESMSPAPETPYAMSKWAGEVFAGTLRSAVPMRRVTSIRLARLYGAAPGLRWSELPHLFSRQAVAGEKITIKGGKQRFDLLHIRDAVRALLHFLEDQKAWQDVYNLGSGGAVSILDVAEAAMRATGTQGGLPAGIDCLPGGDETVFEMKTERFASEFNWAPREILQASVDELVRLARNSAAIA